MPRSIPGGLLPFKEHLVCQVKIAVPEELHENSALETAEAFMAFLVLQ